MQPEKNPSTKKERPDYEERNIQRCLQATPDSHRPTLERFVGHKRNQGKKFGTIENYFRWLQKWCTWFQRPLPQAGRDDVSRYFGTLREAGYGPEMVAQAAVPTKAFYRWLLIDEERPASFWASFPTAAPLVRKKSKS